MPTRTSPRSSCKIPRTGCALGAVAGSAHAMGQLCGSWLTEKRYAPPCPLPSITLPCACASDPDRHLCQGNALVSLWETDENMCLERSYCHSSSSPVRVGKCNRCGTKRWDLTKDRYAHPHLMDIDDVRLSRRDKRILGPVFNLLTHRARLVCGSQAGAVPRVGGQGEELPRAVTAGQQAGQVQAPGRDDALRHERVGKIVSSTG